MLTTESLSVCKVNKSANHRCFTIAPSCHRFQPSLSSDAFQTGSDKKENSSDVLFFLTDWKKFLKDVQL